MYSLFYRTDSIPYLARIRNKVWSNDFVPYSLIYTSDVMIERRVRKLHVSTRIAAVFAPITYNWNAGFGYLERVIVTPILLM